jgi:hypothetical protein
VETKLSSRIFCRISNLAYWLSVHRNKAQVFALPGVHMFLKEWQLRGLALESYLLKSL